MNVIVLLLIGDKVHSGIAWVQTTLYKARRPTDVGTQARSTYITWLAQKRYTEAKYINNTGVYM